MNFWKFLFFSPSLLSERFSQAHFLWCLKHCKSAAGLGVLPLIVHKGECEVSWMTLWEPATLGSCHPLLGHGLLTRKRAAASEEAFCAVKCGGLALMVCLYVGSKHTSGHNIHPCEVDVKRHCELKQSPPRPSLFTHRSRAELQWDDNIVPLTHFRSGTLGSSGASCAWECGSLGNPSVPSYYYGTKSVCAVLHLYRSEESSTRRWEGCSLRTLTLIHQQQKYWQVQARRRAAQQSLRGIAELQQLGVRWETRHQAFCYWAAESLPLCTA